MTERAPVTYRDSGVDIDAGDELVERIKPQVKRSMRREVLGGIGGFGALVEVPLDRYRKPVLVSGTDGVGTKLRVAIDTQRHDTVGIDLVAMCVNDVVVQGAEPLFFLDYFATGKLVVDVGARIVAGIVEGCVQAGCALVGGETAEMPGMYHGDDYDLAGFCVGIVEKDSIIDGTATRAGDVVLGLPSSGPHSNGFSLIRKILQVSGADLQSDLSGVSLVDRLMAPTRIYVKPLLKLIASLPVHGLSHITGGGLVDNIPRVLPDGLEVVLHRQAWRREPVFDWLQRHGNVDDAEMYRVFNCGIGMTVHVAAGDADRAIAILADAGQEALVIGEVRTGTRGVVHRLTSGASLQPSGASPPLNEASRVPIVILISGRGGNMRELIERSRDPRSSFEVRRVLSDQAAAAGLRVASELGVAAQAIVADKSVERRIYDGALAAAVNQSTPALVVLAGFMRILSAQFVEAFAGRILNIHPSLLPKYPGLHTHRRAIEARDKEHGATVHFVTEQLDGGPAIIQARVPVLENDDEAVLSSRVQAVEHRIYPLAVSWFCDGRLRCESGRAVLDGRVLDRPVQYEEIER